MILASLPANCWYVVHHVARSFYHGVRHPLRHPRHVVHHLHRAKHIAPPKRWVEIVCKATHVAGAGAILLGPPAAVVVGAPYLAPPAAEQPAPYGGGGYAGGGGAPAYGGQAFAPGLIPSPEEVVLRPTVPAAPPPLNGVIIPPYVPPTTPINETQPPHPVPEPNSALILAIGFLGALAISVSKKAAR